MKRLPLVLPVGALLVACAQSPSEPNQRAMSDLGFSPQSTDNVVVPVDIVTFVPCADQGQGELVFLSGNLHILFQLTISASGNVSFKDHFQPQGVSGSGQTTGDSYHGTGVTQDKNHFGQVGQTLSFIDNFRIIGQGSSNNFTLHENFHVTVNGNGTITTFVDNISADCK